MRTIEHFLFPHNLPQRYYSSVNLVHYVHLSTKNYKGDQKAETSLKRLSKYQNKNQIWQDCWN
jgi:hypothetical protein